MSGLPIGEFPGSEDDKFYENLQRYVNDVHEYFIGGIFPLRDPVILNDALVFMERLKIRLSSP